MGATLGWWLVFFVFFVSIPSRIRAQVLSPQVLSNAYGRDIRLIRSPSGDRIFLFALGSSVEVRTFDVASRAWEAGSLQAPQTGNVYVFWGGPDYAVDEQGGLHVAWSERGLSDCEGPPGNTRGVRLKHVAYENGSWQPVETLLERHSGDATCYFHHVKIASDQAGRLLVAYLVGAPDGTNVQHRGYMLYDGGWSFDHWLVREKGDLGSGGAFGSFFVGYYAQVSGDHPNVLVEIPPGASEPGQEEHFLVDTVPFVHVPRAPVFAFSGTDEVHMVWAESCSPSWYDCRLLYNHRANGVWDDPGGGTLLYDHSFFADNGSEDRAYVALAASEQGPVLVAFTFRKKLYLVQWDGVRWSGPTLVSDIQTEAHYPAAALVSDTTFLVAWTDGPSRAGQVSYGFVTVCPSGQTRCGNDCVDLSSDPNHCGRCDRACNSGETCQGGECVTLQPDAGTVPDVASPGPDALSVDVWPGDAGSSDANPGADVGPSRTGVTGGCDCSSSGRSSSSFPASGFLWFFLAFLLLCRTQKP